MRVTNHKVNSDGTETFTLDDKVVYVYSSRGDFSISYALYSRLLNCLENNSTIIPNDIQMLL